MSKLPRSWAGTTLSEIATLGPKSEWTDDTDIGFVPMSHAPTNFRDVLKYEPRPWHEVKKAYTHFENGDVIFAKVTPCFENGKAARVSGLPNGAGAGSSEFHVLRPRSTDISASYLLALIKSAEFLRAGEESMTGAVGLRRVPRAFVESFPISLPPAAEQKRIAQKLDALLAQVDTLKARIDAIPVLLRRFRERVLSASFEDACSGRGTVALKEFCLSVSDGDHQAPPQGSGDVPFITISAINDSVLRLEKSTRLVPKAYADSIRQERKPKGGDVLFSVTGTICVPAMVAASTPDFVFQRHIALLRPDPDQASQKYLYWMLKSPEMYRQGFNSATGTAQLTIPLKKLREFTVPRLTIPEQGEVVERLEMLFAFADELEAKVTAAQKRIDALTQSLLAKAFRGELVPQDPTDEPASVLLERIRVQRAAAPKSKRARKAATS